jgi:hypothetical protein
MGNNIEIIRFVYIKWSVISSLFSEALKKVSKYNESLVYWLFDSGRPDTVEDNTPMYLIGEMPVNSDTIIKLCLKRKEGRRGDYLTVETPRNVLPEEIQEVKIFQTSWKYTLKGYGRQIDAESIPEGFEVFISATSQGRTGRYGCRRALIIKKKGKIEL